MSEGSPFHLGDSRHNAPYPLCRKKDSGKHEGKVIKRNREMGRERHGPTGVRATCADIRLTPRLTGTRAPAVTVTVAFGAALILSHPRVDSLDTRTDVEHKLGGLVGIAGHYWSPCNEQVLIRRPT